MLTATDLRKLLPEQQNISTLAIETLIPLLMQIQNVAYLEGANNAFSGLRGKMKQLELAKKMVAATAQHLGKPLATHEAADLAMLFLGLNKPEGDPNAT